MELPRILLIATSVMLLVYRYGYGGIGELKALAEVRVDVADGSLDGFADTKKLEHSKKHSTHITHSLACNITSSFSPGIPLRESFTDHFAEGLADRLSSFKASP